jgi:hypothetical protein
MRGGKLEGRFSIDYEAQSMYEGISEDLGGLVGMKVDWWKWSDEYLLQNYTTVVDDIYDVSSSSTSTGRRWEDPIKFPVVMAQFVRGTNIMNQRGFYVADTLRLVINVGDVNELMPTILYNSNSHIKDRIVYRGEVFVPTRVLPRGAFEQRWAVVTVDCNQVNPEELVNDPQFQSYALPSTSELRTIGYGLGSYGSEKYGE